ncbi:Glycosyl transferase, group 1 [Nitrosococcus oceani ATCC 19707]|uniref:Glycosyl transferase, group 1 n=2 Tax=Nitrosococcus oceani TaxID=1229 RepID=Q3JD41_NITOC|nr:glycosyltransferase family 4 protein [Nitrosococcus oceani]ABA57255.1 Glycosyl transferase, group 1 [Nitrosococcus oceani ATCC 19707]EDZ66609.1 glycosyl transferase, group 1 family protein [Nitrosococcus oceani AFC27]KFI20229.1 glycosyl transferase family 1 [Nitrosococcus oceani C-27]GEM20127.1 glycosyl transferase family 1 [Nitrosococcus oceani]
MNIGFISNWCNRGQGIVTRQIRAIFAEAGHDTYVLARPTRARAAMPNLIDSRQEWQVPHLTHGSAYDMPVGEYMAWAKESALDVLFCDMNMQFEAIVAIRKLGVRTIGRFVWEAFHPDYVAAVKQAYDIVYSLTRCEQENYRKMGISSPYVRFGLAPSFTAFSPIKRPDDALYFFFHGGTQGTRKPIQATLKAFKQVKNPHIRLIIKSQCIDKASEPVTIEDDPRITHIVADLPFEEHRRLFSSCHVCLCPSRWEGLGVHLFEALAYGMPVISNDIAPINEVIRHGRSGLLVRSFSKRKNRCGLPIFEPDEGHLRECIEELSNPVRLAALMASTREEAKQFDWALTRQDYLELATCTRENLSRKQKNDG